MMDSKIYPCKRCKINRMISIPEKINAGKYFEVDDRYQIGYACFVCRTICCSFDDWNEKNRIIEVE